MKFLAVLLVACICSISSAYAVCTGSGSCVHLDNGMPGAVPAAALPNPSASTLGGVLSGAAPGGQFMTGINTSGAPQFTAFPTTTSLSSGTYFSTPDYAGSNSHAIVQAILGTVAAPNTTLDAASIIEAVMAPSSGLANAELIGARKAATCAYCGVGGIYAETFDPVGGTDSFIQGVEGMSVLTGGTNGSATGLVGLAASSTSIPYKYLNAVEGQIYNNSGTDATTTFAKTKFSTAFIAANSGTNASDAAFMANPYNGGTFVSLFYAPIFDAGQPDSVLRSDATTNHILDFNRATCLSTCIVGPGGKFTLDNSGNVAAASIASTGTPPTNSGSCALNTQLGGNTIGTFKASGACASGTYILTFASTAAHGWTCSSNDISTAAGVVRQSDTSTTWAKLTATSVLNTDLIGFACFPY